MKIRQKLTCFLLIASLFLLPACTQKKDSVLKTIETASVNDMTFQYKDASSNTFTTVSLYVDPVGYSDTSKPMVEEANEIWKSMFQSLQKDLKSSKFEEVEYSSIHEDNLVYLFEVTGDETKILYLYNDGMIKTVSGSNRSCYSCRNLIPILENCNNAVESYIATTPK